MSVEDFRSYTRLKQMREKVKEELDGIPRGNISQNDLRQIYWAMRTHYLGKKVRFTLPKEEVLIKSIKIIQADNPDFRPRIEREIFDIKKVNQIAKKEKVIIEDDLK